MITKKIFKTSLLIVVMGFSLYSCQSLALLYFGVKNPERPVNKEERLAYYEPFINNHKALPLKLYVLSDTTKWLQTYHYFEGYSFPMVYLRNQKTDSLYTLSCFEDIEWEIGLINNGNLKYTYAGEEEKLAYIKQFIADSSKIVYDSKTVSSDSIKWQVQMVSATFLGKKLRKRMLSIMELEGLGSLTILDISNIEK